MCIEHIGLCILYIEKYKDIDLSLLYLTLSLKVVYINHMY